MDIRGDTRQANVGRALEQLAELAPTVPRVVRIAPTANLGQLAAVVNAGRLYAHTVLIDGGNPAETLRSVLTDPSLVSATVVEWMASRFRLLPHELRLELAGSVAGLEVGAVDAGADDRARERADSYSVSWRTKLRRLRLPSPVQWSCLGRAIHAARAIQANPDTRISDVAFDLRFEQQSSLTALIRRSFDLRPIDIRGTLGLGWLLDRWAILSELIDADLLQSEHERAVRSYGTS